MNDTPFQPKKNLGGLPANRVIVPLVVILAIFHIAIIGLILSISSQSSQLSQTMQRSGSYIEEATSLLAGSSLLSETALNFVLAPTTQDGEVNIHPLVAYANELTTDRRGDQIVERFRGYHVSDEIMDYLTTAAASANNMMEAQLHALALMTSIYPLPDIPPLDTIPIPALTPEEQAWPDAKKEAQAKVLVLGAEYGQNKQNVSYSVTDCTAALKQDMGQQAAQTAQRVNFLRTALWIATLLIILILVITFVTLYRLLIFPLRGSVRLITQDQALNENRGLLEMRQMAFSYNGLLRRRDALEGILRSAAVTDTLTNLPNRYGYEQYLLDVEADSVAVLLFDVNFLKRTNDTLGHAAGDKLLQSAADCIALCFGTPERDNCFRFGGDEFAALVRDVTPEELEQMIQRFRTEQNRRSISVAWGCAYTPELRQTTFKALMDQADKEMYRRKEEMHAQEPGYIHSHNLA